MVSLLYGAGLRLLEALDLRVKDLDLERREITVPEGKGRKDRRTVMPEAVREPMARHLAEVQERHRADLARGFGRVALPGGLERKYPNAALDWPWQYVFPASRICRDPRFGRRRGITCTRRPFSGRSPRRYGGRASRSGRAATRFRHSFATYLWRPATTSVRCRSCSGMRT